MPEIPALWLSVFMLFVGIITHFLKKLMEASSDGAPIGALDYWRKNPYRSCLSVLGAVVAFVAAYSTGETTPMSAFLIGVTANSAADLFARVKPDVQRVNAHPLMVIMSMLLLFSMSGCAVLQAQTNREKLLAASADVEAIALSIANQQAADLVSAEQAQTFKTSLLKTQYLIDAGMLVETGQESSSVRAELLHQMQAGGETPALIADWLALYDAVVPADRPLTSLDVLLLVNRMLLKLRSEVRS